MDSQAAEIGAWVGGAVATALGAVLAVLRRRRKRGKGWSFRPRARIRTYISLRTHGSSPTNSIEPPAFDDERDTGRHHRPRDKEPHDE